MPQPTLPAFEPGMLYIQQVFTLIKDNNPVGVITCHLPSTTDADPDPTRQPIFIGTVSMTAQSQDGRQHQFPLTFPLIAGTLNDACLMFADSCLRALDEYQAEMFRRALVTPGAPGVKLA